MEFTLGKIYSWQEVSRHWQHMADGGEDGWLPPDHEDPPGRMPGSKVTEVKSWKLVELDISEVRPHYACDDEIIEAYRNYRKKTGKSYPPIIVEEKEDTYQTLDGCHRLTAAKRDGDKKIRAFIPWQKQSFTAKVKNSYEIRSSHQRSQFLTSTKTT